MVELLRQHWGKQFVAMFCLFGILPFTTSVVQGQTPVNNKVLKYSLKDGLSFEIANSITQDARGFIWIATSDGLNRFDGSSFKVFKSKQRNSLGLLSNYVEKVYTDKAGFIWVGSRDGLSRLDPRTESFTHYKVNAGRTAKEDVNNIVPARGDNLWVSTYGIGFSYFDAKKTRFINYRQNTFPQLGDDRVISLSEDSQGLLWVGTQEAGLNLFEQKNGVIGNRLNLGADAPSGRINDIFEDHFHNVWIAAVSGMFYYNRSLHKFYHLTSAQAGIRNKRYLSLNEGSDKKLLVGLQDGGLYKLDLGTSANYNVRSFSLEPVTGEDGFNITQRSIQTLFIDRDKNTWVGTYGNGIYMLGNKTEKFTRVQRKHADAQGESMVRFYGMSQDNAGMLWLGTDGDGLLKTSPDGTLIKQYKADGRPGSLTDNAILSGFTDSDNNSWFGTYAKGLFLYNRATDNFTNFAHTPGMANSLGGNDVRVIFQDSHKQLWIGSNGGGLSLYNPKSRSFTNYTPINSAISSNDIRAIAEDTKGNLWIGTFGGGLDYFDVNRNKFVKPLNTADEKRSLPSAVVFSLIQDKQQKLWIGTEGDGLLVYDLRNKTLKVFDESTGLANNTVYAIKQAANGILWLSTNKGLSSIDPLSGKIENYDQSDGVQAGQFNVGSAMYNDKRKAMYFGGTQGLNIFYPSQVYKSNYRPGVVITGLQIFDKQVDVDGHDKNGAVLPNVLNETEELVLQPDQPVFSIQYTALNYAYPQKGNFAYKMDGLDKAWNYVGTQRSATYRYLSPGTYVFRVKASNQDGVWFNNYATLQIRVLPPWYKTWWAYLCYVLAAGLLINYYRLYRINQSRLKYEIKIAQLSAEKDKELNERKLSFFTNISHEFRTPLTLIINPVKDMLFGKIEHGNDAGNLHIIYRNARRLLSLVDQLLLFRKAESDTDKLKVVKLNVVTLCREVFLCFNHQARTRFIQFDFVCEAETIEIYADREKLEIALFNLISNALKFTPEHGFVSCTITDSGDKVDIAIKDSGCGIAEGTGDDLFGKFYQLQNAGITAGGFGIGLYLVKAFIENHKGSITYQSEAGKGTVFNVSLLKGKEHLGQQFIFEDVQETSAFLDELIDSDEDMLMAEAEIAAPHMKSEALSSDTKTMLLIDDNQQIRTYLKQIFTGKFEVFEADNGTDGLELVYHLVPDIVISDVMMQGLSGIELCSRIKEDPVLNHIPVILLTASSSPEIKLKGIEGGADDYISKPFEKEMLVARVNGILKSRNNLQKYFYNEITLNNTNDLKISQEYKEFLEKCLQIVEKHLTDPDFSIKTLAAETGMSHSNLYKRIKSISGQSANSFIRFIRLRKAAEILLTTDSTVYETAYKVGLNDLKYFREQFFKLFGINPSDYIKKYRKPFHNNYNINRDVLKEN